MRSFLPVFVGSVLVVFAGCGGSQVGSGESKPSATPPAETTSSDIVAHDTDHENAELVILAGNSFIPPTEQLIAEFTEKTGVKATYTTGGSEDLLPHVKARQRGDIFITHDPYLDYTEESGSCSDHVHVGFVAPVLAVQKGNPKDIQSIDDLTRAGLKVAIRSIKTAFDEVDRRLENVALTLGYTQWGSFFHVSLPLARPGVVAGAILTWARAFGIFGPLMIFVGSFRGKTEVLSTTIYLEQSVGNLEVALAVALLLISVAVVALLTIRLVGGNTLVKL